MPLNKYFSHKVKSEQDLYEDLIIQAIQCAGIEVYYIPRKIVNLNAVFNEEALSEFGKAYMIEAYLESVDGFTGDGDLLSKFGLEVRDQAVIAIARRRFKQLVGQFLDPEEAVKCSPKDGDLIYIPMAGALFEIHFVEDEEPFYQLQNLHTYKLTIEFFQYNNEVIETGIEDIDSVETDFAVRTELNLDTVSGDWELSEYITQDVGGVTITGEIAEIISPEKIEVVNIRADDGSNTTFAIGGNQLIGADSGTTANLVTVDNFNPLVHDPASQNNDFEDIGNNFIDFSETNPFGEIDTI